MSQFGIKVYANEHVEVGKPILGAWEIIMHPLDAIAISFPRDPARRLTAVAQYFADRAHRELDAVLERMKREVDEMRFRTNWEIDVALERARMRPADFGILLDEAEFSRRLDQLCLSIAEKS